MPRKDPTFTDADLIRLFCKNLEPAEKMRVTERFRKYVLSRTPICSTDPVLSTDFCAWAKAFLELTDKADSVAQTIPYVLSVLAALESALTLLSWAGWIGRAVAVLRVAVAWMIAFVTFTGALIIMFSKLHPYAASMVVMFCKYQDAELKGDPPNPEGLPKSPDEKLQEMIDEIKGWFGDLFSEQTTTPPDEWPPSNVPDEFT